MGKIFRSPQTFSNFVYFIEVYNHYFYLLKHQKRQNERLCKILRIFGFLRECYAKSVSTELWPCISVDPFAAVSHIARMKSYFSGFLGFHLSCQFYLYTPVSKNTTLCTYPRIGKPLHNMSIRVMDIHVK